jgi:hypothetical protein
MPLRYLIDECSIGRNIIRAIQRHNATFDSDKIDFVCVGDGGAPATGSEDDVIVRWSALNGRTIVSRDANTLIATHTQFVVAGNASSGLLILRPGLTAVEIVEWLALLSMEDAESFASTTQFLPLG